VRRIAWVGLFCAVPLVASCGGHHAGSPPAPAATSTVNPATLTGSGCGRAVQHGSTDLTLTVAGRMRTAIVHIPGTYQASRRTPLVLNMHGSASTAASQEGFTGMDATADADDFIVIYPQALIPQGSGFDWNIPGVPLYGGTPVPAGSADDISFLTTLVHAAEHLYCVDPSRVYATGFSGGARMSSQLACDASGVFAAVAPVSGLRLPTSCPAKRAVPVLSFHGTADPIDPYGGHGQAYWTYSVPQAAKDWSRHDRCSSAAQTSHPAATVTLTRYSGCRDGAAVELYTISGEGHEWPGGPHLPPIYTKELGPQSTAVSADALIWAFFRAHPLP